MDTLPPHLRRFPLGSVVSTRRALNLLSAHNRSPLTFLARHQTGDWGEVPPDDAKANEEALKTGARLMSAYTIDSERLWVITEADRSVTTLLLPSEY